MCFTPIVSLSTAIIEWILATILIVFFKKTNLRIYFAGLIYVLGLYQYTEFMLCTTGYPLLWAKIGFITYTFLPAMALHSVLRVLKRNAKLIWIYLIPILTSLIAIITSNFIASAECTSLFVQVRIVLMEQSGIIQNMAYWIYMLYYFGFLVIALGFILKDYFRQRSKIKKEIEIVEIVGAFMMLGPTLLLVVILPYLDARFPSILCGFAIFFAIATFVIAYLETKLKKS